MRHHPGRCDRTDMPGTDTHEIVLRGRLGGHVLGPFVDDFTIVHDLPGTRLVGRVRDASHLHGLVAFLASINAELISITPISPNTPNHDPRSTS